MRKLYLALAVSAAMGLAGCGAEPAGTENGAAAGTKAETQAESGAQEAAGEEKAQESGEASDGAEEPGAKAAGEDGGQENAQGEDGEGKDSKAEVIGGADGKTEIAVSDQASTASMEHSGFVFQTGDTVIGMNEDVSPILAELGKETAYSETTSCAFKGLDKIYSYPGFDLYTYPLDGKDNVNSVYFTDETAKTPEGIGIGSTEEEMLAAYGEDYTEEFGVYTYAKDRSTLSFIVTDGLVESVEYTAVTE